MADYLVLTSLLRKCLLIGLLWAGCMGLAQAGSFSVGPVRIYLTQQQPNSTVTIRNTSSEPLRLQASLARWNQANGQDVFAETDDVVSNPPVFAIDPGQSQIIRVGLLLLKPSSTEQTYRLFVEELPARKKAAGAGVQTLFRISLPIFVQDSTPGAIPQMAWSLAPAGQGSWRLTATNTGDHHVQVRQFNLYTLGGAPLFKKDVADYILVGQSRQWMIKAAALGSQARVKLDVLTDHPKADPLQPDMHMMLEVQPASASIL